MSPTFQRATIAFSGVIMVGLAVVTLLAMVIAPPCTGIINKASEYKIASICVFLSAFYFIAWRRRSVIASVALPALQIASGLLFASYLNSLPMSCPQ